MADRAIRIRVAVCLVEDDRILLVQHQKASRTYWLLPGGGVEVGETLVSAATRELLEETGLQIEVGRLVLVCEAVEPGGRHLLNLVFAGRIAGGALRAGRDHRLVEVEWVPIDALPGLEMYPPIAGELHHCCLDRFRGELRVLGNVWRVGEDAGLAGEEI